MKKILFLLGMYHPQYSANGLCTKNVVDELVYENYKVTCICNNSSDCFHECIDGADLYYIKPRLHQKIKRKADEVNNIKYKTFLQKSSLLFSKLQLVVMSFFWPFVSPIYALRFYKKAKELYIRENYDIVISVYTPFESLLAGYWLKKRYPKIKFIPYYLDALAGGWGPSFFSEINIEKHTKKWEKKIDKKADWVISMNSSATYHEKTVLCSKEKRLFLDVPILKESYNCFSEEPIALYAGSLNFKGRNIKKLLDIFSIICLKTDLKLILAGTCEDSKLFDQYKEKTDGKIQYLGVLPHVNILEIEKKVKYLVNLGSNNPYTIPSKIFEYMRFGKTIISTYSSEQEPSIEYLNKYKNVIFLDERLSIDEAADKLLKEMKVKKKVERVNLEEVFYYNTPRAFVNLIKGLEE